MGARKYFFTDEQDRLIREIYLNEVGIKSCQHTGPVKVLAKKFGMPRWRVSKRALELGILPLQRKEPNWYSEELEVLERNAHRMPPTIQRYLQRAGYHRTIQGIVLKRKRLHLSRTSMDGYTACSLAECFGLDVKAITRWVFKGLLKAQKRGTARTRQQGGDEWFIRDRAVKKFIVANVAIIDFRKIDKYWLVDLFVDGGE